MLIPPADASHFLRVYQELLHRIAEFEGTKPADFLPARIALYGKKYRAHPPTDDADLLAALQTAVYGDFAIGRHLVRCTEMVGPEEQVFRVAGLTNELGDFVPPWVMAKTAVMLFKGHWICDGLIQGGNIHIGPNMRRELAETIRAAKLPAPAAKKIKRAAGAKLKIRKTGESRMTKPQEDKEREDRISDEIVVDANGPEERALGWYYYLDDRLNYPFAARCINVRPISPLKKGEVVEVAAMPPAEECEREMFVEIRWKKQKLAVPLSQLEVLDKDADEETTQAVEDWHYWVGRDYGF